MDCNQNVVDITNGELIILIKEEKRLPLGEAVERSETDEGGT